MSVNANIDMLGQGEVRAVGNRYFAKVVDGRPLLCETVATGVKDAEGNMTYKDLVVSNDPYNAMNAFTDVEFRSIDKVVTQTSARPDSIVNWLLGKQAVRRVIDGMAHMTHEYKINKPYKGVAQTTMKLEEDVSGGTIAYEEDGVPLPFIFTDFHTNLREDKTASRSSGIDTIAQKAEIAAKVVAETQDWSVVNGYGDGTRGLPGSGFQYRGFKAWGFRDVPTNMALTTSGDWFDDSASGPTTQEIFDDILNAVKMLVKARIPGPYTLIVPNSYRFIFMRDYFRSPFDNSSQSLYQRILESPRPGVPNELNIEEIYFNEHFDVTRSGADNDSAVEAYLMSFSPEYFNALRTLKPTTFTIDLKGSIATKHRVVSGFTPLFRRNGDGNYGIVRIAS